LNSNTKKVTKHHEQLYTNESSKKASQENVKYSETNTGAHIIIFIWYVFTFRYGLWEVIDKRLFYNSNQYSISNAFNDRQSRSRMDFINWKNMG